MDDDILKLDLYEIIGATITATESEIKKAYRKKALICHPDKNPDNPKAAELFLQLSKALEILTDVAARAAYDKVINAKVQAKARASELSAKRKKFKDDLEAREEAFRRSQSDERNLKAEIERIRKEGSRLLEEEKERLRQKVLEEIRKATTNNGYTEDECRVKIKWKVDANDTTNGGYDYNNLYRILSKHGDISVLVMPTAKQGRALVEFKNGKAAQDAVNYEIGLITNPLTLTGVWQKGKDAKKPQSYSNTLFSGVNLFPSAEGSMKNQMSQGLNSSSGPDFFNAQSHSDADLESIVLNNLKKAEERKRLSEQMQNEKDKTLEYGQTAQGATKTQTNFNTLFSGVSLFPSVGESKNAKKSNMPQGLSFSSAPDIFNIHAQKDTNSENIVKDLKRAEERRRLIEQMQDEDERTQSNKEADLENSVLKEQKRAEERKRLIEQMQEDERNQSNSEADLENSILKEQKRAEERRRLIEQMQEEDERTET